MKKIQPLNNNVLLLIEKEEEKKTAGGIIIPDTVGTKKNEGKVVAIAADAPKGVEVGDTVLYKEFSGNEMTIDGKKHLLVQYDDLLAKYAKGDAI